MAYKNVACAGCNKTLRVGVTTHKPRYCSVCRQARMAEAITALATRSGPMYEKWYASRWGNNRK